MMKIDPVTIRICKISFECVSLFIEVSENSNNSFASYGSLLDPKSHDWSHCCCSFAVLIMYTFGILIWDKIK